MEKESLTIQELSLVAGVSDKTIRRFLRSLKLQKPDTYARVVKEEPTNQGKFIYKLDETFFYTHYKVSPDDSVGLSSQGSEESRQGEHNGRVSRQNEAKEEESDRQAALEVENELLKEMITDLKEDKKSLRDDVAKRESDIKQWQDMAKSNLGYISHLESRVKQLEAPKVRHVETEVPRPEPEPESTEVDYVDDVSDTNSIERGEVTSEDTEKGGAVAFDDHPDLFSSDESTDATPN